MRVFLIFYSELKKLINAVSNSEAPKKLKFSSASISENLFLGTPM
ncbi:protein of unknown function [Streptococcus thermophilus]|uniref:Uncharacterized protein n=1 Tax=Streptococcus thermophilus TaxID=1308 RepID=A0A8D6U6Q6_STRTR|nr:protein of unknown function [Streptococcus thermophilus]CAD0126951.1 protein of unknown function [Streptococcus thermophilus]CAD0137373.1 protein of unknown function [Streptococcus thermophilus]CAD0141684.1 protein of unknown function [Streptococcus thermophilus]CAD0144938.1 protein of unknown function [Streptococcus thermophilus]